MDINQIALARKVLDHVSNHPEVHDQGTFFDEAFPNCGTVACVAGWAVILNGEHPMNLGGWKIGVRAQALLGLTDEQREALFFDTTSESHARDLLASYIAEAEAAL